MSYRWKPNASQKAAYAAKMRESDTYVFMQSRGPIRTGCRVEFFSITHGAVIAGTVVKHSYGSDRGQHTFTILQTTGQKVLVKGRNLYQRLISHTPGHNQIIVTVK